MIMFEIRKVIHINASRERIFSALTNSEEIPKYYPLNEVQSQWDLGSEVLYKGEVNGAPFTDYGVIEKLGRCAVRRQHTRVIIAQSIFRHKPLLHLRR